MSDMTGYGEVPPGEPVPAPISEEQQLLAYEGGAGVPEVSFPNPDLAQEALAAYDSQIATSYGLDVPNAAPALDTHAAPGNPFAAEQAPGAAPGNPFAAEQARVANPLAPDLAPPANAAAVPNAAAAAGGGGAAPQPGGQQGQQAESQAAVQEYEQEQKLESEEATEISQGAMQNFERTMNQAQSFDQTLSEG